MKPLRWVLRAAWIGFFVSLLLTVAISIKSNSSDQPFIPLQRLSLWERLSRKFLWGIGSRKDAFELSHKGPVVWNDFREEVSDNDLRKVDAEFVEPILGGILDHVLRRGHGDVGITETSAQHTRRLRELGKEYQEPMELDNRELLEMLLMLGVHETPEALTFDTRRYNPLSTKLLRRKVKNFKPASVRSERNRMLREWRRERPFVFAVSSGYDERRRRIILYLYDRFYLGRDRVATFARQLHYFQPARDIADQTSEKWVIDWFLTVAFAYLTNERLRDDLVSVHGIKRSTRSATN